MLARRSLLTLAVAASSSTLGCSIVVQGLLDDAAANVAEGEGDVATEGEGDVVATEGEGDVVAEGEGDTANDNDPACEEDERLVIVRDDSVDVLQVYDLLPGRFLRRFPADQGNVNVNLENDDPNANNNGFGVDAFAIGSDHRLYLSGGSFVYQLDSSTLAQENIAAKPELRLGGSAYTIQVIGGQIVTAGDSLLHITEGPLVGQTPEAFAGPNDDYHRSIRFSVGNEDFVAINSRFGYVVLSSVDGGPPSPTVVYDEDFTEVRFHEYGGGTFAPRGIAFDPTTRKLLLGDPGRVIVLNYDNGFAIGDPNDDAGDFVLPNGSEALVQAIATRGGFAWVLLERGIDNLIKLDLSQSPPLAVDIATVDTGSFGRSITVGCRRVVVGSFDKLIAVDRNDLSPIATLAISDLEQISIVKRTTLGLAGDDGT